MKQKIYKDLILIAKMGFMYMGLELIWRGRTDLAMWVVGGLCATLIGRLNEPDRFPDMKIWQQSIVGVLITLTVEFISGMYLNVYKHFNIWDYTDIWGNLYGQICIPYAILWFLLMPFCIFIDDYLRYKLFQEEEPQGLLNNYINLFTGK